MGFQFKQVSLARYISSSTNRDCIHANRGSRHSIIVVGIFLLLYFLASTSYRQLFASRYLSSGGLCQPIYRDHRVDDRSRRGIRRQPRRVLPAAAVEEAAAVAPAAPVPLPGCRRHAPCRKPRCSPGVATSRGHRSMPATPRNRGGNPAGTHPRQLPGERFSSSRRGVSREE